MQGIPEKDPAPPMLIWPIICQAGLSKMPTDPHQKPIAELAAAVLADFINQLNPPCYPLSSPTPESKGR